MLASAFAGGSVTGFGRNSARLLPRRPHPPFRCVDLGRSPCEPAAAFDRRRYLAMTAQVGAEAGWWPTVWLERTAAFVVSGSPGHRQPGAHGGLERPWPHRRHSARRPGCGDGARGSATGRVRLGARCAVVMTKADDVPEVEIERTTQSLAPTWTCGCAPSSGHLANEAGAHRANAPLDSPDYQSCSSGPRPHRCRSQRQNAAQCRVRRYS